MWQQHKGIKIIQIPEIQLVGKRDLNDFEYDLNDCDIHVGASLSISETGDLGIFTQQPLCQRTTVNMTGLERL